MIEEIKYNITLDCDIIEGDRLLLSKGEKLQLSEDRYKTLCSNNYIYIPLVISQNVNIQCKIMLTDIQLTEKIVTTKYVIKNPEAEYPD